MQFPFRRFVIKSSSCQPWSQSQSWKITPIDYFHGFSLGFYEANVIMLRRFHGVKCCETKREAVCALWSHPGWVFVSEMTTQMFPFLCNSMFTLCYSVTECKHVVCLHWKWARRRESWGHRRPFLPSGRNDKYLKQVPVWKKSSH